MCNQIYLEFFFLHAARRDASHWWSVWGFDGDSVSCGDGVRAVPSGVCGQRGTEMP